MSSLKALLSVTAVLCILCSCSVNEEWFVTHTGNMPANDRIEQVKQGQTKDEVRYILGAPSTVVSLDKNTWIYISSEIKQVAFMAPKEISRDVLTIRFNADGVVYDISRTGMKEGEVVKISEEETESLGHNKGFFEKFFGGTQTYSPVGGGSQGNL